MHCIEEGETMMSGTSKKWILRYMIVLVLAALAVYRLSNIAIRCTLWANSGGCIAIVHDKAAMRAADKVVLCVGESRYDITNVFLVHWITEETMAATRTGLRYNSHTDRWIEIYHGETLVRRMQWAECFYETGVFVYQEDSTHQIYSGYTGPEEGMIFTSKILAEKLNAIIDAAENTAE